MSTRKFESAASKRKVQKIRKENEAKIKKLTNYFLLNKNNTNENSVSQEEIHGTTNNPPNVKCMDNESMGSNNMKSMSMESMDSNSMRTLTNTNPDQTNDSTSIPNMADPIMNTNSKSDSEGMSIVFYNTTHPFPRFFSLCA